MLASHMPRSMSSLPIRHHRVSRSVVDRAKRSGGIAFRAATHQQASQSLLPSTFLRGRHSSRRYATSALAAPVMIRNHVAYNALSPRRPMTVAKRSREQASTREANGDAATQLTQFGAGALAGLVNTLVLSPLDVVKTRLQVQGSASAAATQYRGLFDALRSMLREEGLRSYYRGLSASLWAFVPNWAIYWYTYETFKRTYSNGTRPTPFVHVLSALSAGGITAVTTAPFWTLKSRLQVDMTSALAKRKYKSVPQGFKKIMAEEGVSGLYKGLTPTLLGLGHVAIQFPLYEHIKSSLAGEEYDEFKAMHVLVASSVSKIAASAVFYPHEVLRTRIQIDQRTLRMGMEPARMMRLVREILSRDGARGFYRGFGTNLMRTVPACMLTFTSYELAKRFAERSLERQAARRDMEGQVAKGDTSVEEGLAEGRGR